MLIWIMRTFFLSQATLLANFIVIEKNASGNVTKNIVRLALDKSPVFHLTDE